MPSSGRFDHKDGSGFVTAAEGDYRDALKNRKARVHLLVHETTGGMSPFAVRRLRRLARAAAENDNQHHRLHGDCQTARARV